MKVTILRSPGAGVSLVFSLHSTSHTRCLLYHFVSQGSSNSNTTESVYAQGWGSPDVWRVPCQLPLRCGRPQPLDALFVVIVIHAINFLEEENQWPIVSSNKITGISLYIKMTIDLQNLDVVIATNYLELLLLQLLWVPMRWERHICHFIVPLPLFSKRENGLVWFHYLSFPAH